MQLHTLNQEEHLLHPSSLQFNLEIIQSLCIITEVEHSDGNT